MKQTQTQSIQKYLEEGHTITAMEALNLFKCFRLAARISELKKLGMNITKEMITKNRSTFAVYKVAK